MKRKIRMAALKMAEKEAAVETAKALTAPNDATAHHAIRRANIATKLAQALKGGRYED